MFGPATERFKDIRDGTIAEMVPVAALVIAILAVGIYPAFLIDVFAVGLEPIAQSLEQAVRIGLR